MPRRIHHDWQYTPPPGSTDWMGRGACRDHTDIMFPTRTCTDGRTLTDDEYADAVVAAKRYCEICVVRIPCRDHAMQVSAQIELHGVWGGTSEEDRAEAHGFEMVHNPRSLKGCGTSAGERRHRRRGEPLCDNSRAYVTRERRERRERQKARAGEHHG